MKHNSTKAIEITNRKKSNQYILGYVSIVFTARSPCLSFNRALLSCWHPTIQHQSVYTPAYFPHLLTLLTLIRFPLIMVANTYKQATMSPTIYQHTESNALQYPGPCPQLPSSLLLFTLLAILHIFQKSWLNTISYPIDYTHEGW